MKIKRDRVIQIRVSAEEKNMAVRAAEARGLPLSLWARKHLNHASGAEWHKEYSQDVVDTP